MRYLNYFVLSLFSTILFFTPNQVFSITDENFALMEMEQQLSDSAKLEAQTPYLILENMFEYGEMPTREELHGWFSGRCYLGSNENKPINTLLMGEYSYNNGPLFPNSFHLVSILNGSQPEDYYDYLTEEKISGINNWLINNRKYISVAEEDSGALASSYIDNTTNARYMIKKKNNYYIEAVKENLDITLYCYYFKKVKD